MAEDDDPQEKQDKAAKTWENMQLRPVSEQLARLAERKGWGPAEIGPRAGYPQHSSASRFTRPGPHDRHGMVRVANALGAELLVVPKGTEQSVLARAHEANERELLVAAALLDLLLEFRDDPEVLQHFERHIPWMRQGALERRNFRGNKTSA